PFGPRHGHESGQEPRTKLARHGVMAKSGVHRQGSSPYRRISGGPTPGLPHAAQAPQFIFVQDRKEHVRPWGTCRMLLIGAAALGASGLLRRVVSPSPTVTGHSTILRYRPGGGHHAWTYVTRCFAAPRGGQWRRSRTDAAEKDSRSRISPSSMKDAERAVLGLQARRGPRKHEARRLWRRSTFPPERRRGRRGMTPAGKSPDAQGRRERLESERW